ncbi:MarR family winged helix-turn-helix transcriptional regulator [Roseateles puraquae]|uniref:MarR family transcriptional regulator n=1 Tax=Roseateles puraquae TaxID=431059 RepID=A0A254NB08_9BURK|nr:MarR family transcriptional regulator [Roseateles puraquae]MDG0852835.1 MarR family transcriptional regulator [Roseateles puraquae]OWR05159.1 MarR family transcriptional regulator [Roseateles puraquae]
MPRHKATADTATSPPDAREQWLRLDQQLCFALYSSSLAMTKLYKPLLAPLGLTYPQYLVMLVLWEADGLAVGQLGQRLSLDSGTLTPLLKRLEALGHLERRRAQDDERRVDIFLTPAGRKLRRQALDIPGQLACASACDLTELAALTRRLHELRGQLAAASEAA